MRQMSTIDDGGPAFPAERHEDFAHQGMSLRDYFAAKALQGMLSNSEFMQDDNGHRNNTFANYARAAYMQADSMLAERAKRRS
jgi:hypothetical protein